MSELNDRDRELVALGAAIASNCVPCVEYHIPQARRAGLNDIQIRQALQVADRVRRVPARMVLQTALARVDESPRALSEPDGAGCGCTGSSRDAASDCDD